MSGADSDDNDQQTTEQYGDASNQDCEMPECDGTPADEVKSVKDPEGELMKMCEGCLNAGWRGVVEVLD